MKNKKEIKKMTKNEIRKLNNTQIKKKSKHWTRSDWEHYLARTIDKEMDYRETTVKLKFYNRIKEVRPFPWASQSGSAPEQEELVRHAINALPNKQKRVIEMFFFEGFTGAEIAKKLKRSRITVRHRKTQGLRGLKCALEQKRFTHSLYSRRAILFKNKTLEKRKPDEALRIAPVVAKRKQAGIGMYLMLTLL